MKKAGNLGSFKYRKSIDFEMVEADDKMDVDEPSPRLVKGPVKKKSQSVILVDNLTCKKSNGSYYKGLKEAPRSQKKSKNSLKTRKKKSQCFI
jgi:hypothetical protein